MRPSQNLQIHNPRQRKRQFRDLRQSHSRHKNLQESQLSKSLVRSGRNLQFMHERQSCSRVNNLQNQQSKVLKQSNLSASNIRSHSHNNLVCVCCYNKKQAQLKRKREARQRIKKQEETYEVTESLIKSNRHKQQVYEGHVRQNVQQMTVYNKKQIERHQRQRRQIQDKKRQDHDRIKMQAYDFQMQKQTRLKQNHQQQQLLKQKLEEQMRVREIKDKRRKQQMDFQNENVCIVDSIIPNRQYDPSAVQRIHTQYRHELLKQIEEKQSKKKRQIQDRRDTTPGKSGNEFQLVTFAQKRNQQARKIASKLKQNIINDLNQKKSKQQNIKNQKQTERLQNQHKRRQNFYQQAEQSSKQQEQRRKKIDNYLCDLKSQIEQNKRKRIQELQWMNEHKLVEPIIRVRQVEQAQKQRCGGCQKKYPKRLLSQFVQVIQD